MNDNDMNKNETVLTAFTAVCASALMSTPEDKDPIELTDEQLDQLADQTPSPLWTAAMALLDSIHDEEPHFQTIKEENRKANWEDQETEDDRGLRTEINRSTTHVNLADTLDGCSDVLKRHPFGYKHGSRDSKGRPVVEPYTAAENEAAEQWLASLKQTA